MAEYEPYTKEERERLVASMERWNMLGQDRVIEVFAGAVVIEVRRYEATVAALEAEVTEAKDNYQTMLDTACQEVKKRQELEAELARLRPLAAVGEFAVDERRAYKRYMAGEYGDWLEKRNAARQGVWDTADAILAQEEDGE